MDDETLYLRQLRTLSAFDDVLAEAGPDSWQLEFDGVTAMIVPATPDRSVLNGVNYERPEALEAAYDQIASEYHAAGIRAWTVWVPRADEHAARVLEAAGHVLDASPAVMCASIEDLDLDRGLRDAISWTGAVPVASLGRICAGAFGFDEGELAAALANSPPGAHGYVAELDGEQVASVMAYDHDGDCGIFFVGTLEHARGRGLSKGLMTAALLDARDRGCTTTSLQATKAGYSVYAGLGYRDLGPIDMWELRS